MRQNRPVTTRHIAQLNVGRALYPPEDPRMSAFMEALDPINALADSTPGFVWRLQTEEGTATSIRIFEDDLMLVNLSVWETVDALRDYVYKSDHVAFLHRRGEWFEKPTEAHLVMWWVPAGHIPTTEEAASKLDQLRAEGPGSDVFTFATIPEPYRPGGRVC